jgi:hypothetical protein
MWTHTSVGLVPSSAFYNIITRISHFLILVWVFNYACQKAFPTKCYGISISSRLHSMQEEPSYLSEIVLVSIRFRMILTQIITRVYKDCFILRHTPYINILTDFAILIPTDRFFNTVIRCLVTLGYIPVHHWSMPDMELRLQ